jgi:DNA-binding transcriptional regulator YdaS (Cro superfamily)
MFYDLTISALVTLLAVAPMAFAAWYDGRVQVPQD